jgi:uncharacterized protein YbjQ (UPF0145 family)
MVPGRRIEESLGIAYGFASVNGKDGGKWMMDSKGKQWPWADSAEHFEALFQEAERNLEASGTKKGGDAVVKIEGKLSRDASGNPEMLLMGTVVKLYPEIPEVEGSTKPPEEKGDSISFQIDGEEMAWKPPQATTPTMDVLKKMRERGVKEVKDYSDDRKQILNIAQEVGMPQERAKMLIDGGFDTIRKIAEASTGNISKIEGINPTQARIIRKKANERLLEE